MEVKGLLFRGLGLRVQGGCRGLGLRVQRFSVQRLRVKASEV